MDREELIRLLTMAFNEGHNGLDPETWRMAMHAIRHGGERRHMLPVVLDDDSLTDLIDNALNASK